MTIICIYSTGLGLEDGRIGDEQITASSSYGIAVSAYNARLNKVSSNGVKGGWAAGKLDLNQWLQVDLGRRYQIHAIATQGLYNYAQWVKTYSLQYSDNGIVFEDYEDGKIFQGNTDYNGIVKNNLEPPIRARYVRVLPKSWKYWVAMRIELYGCK